VNDSTPSLYRELRAFVLADPELADRIVFRDYNADEVREVEGWNPRPAQQQQQAPQPQRVEPTAT
jgi:hypothetical protein